MQKQKSKEFIALCKSYGVDPDVVPEITSFEAACNATGRNPDGIKVTGILEKDQLFVIKHYEMVVITEALNEGRQPDYNDSNEDKIEPWLNVHATKDKPAGVGLSYADYDCWCAYTVVGPRLTFRNTELAKFAVKHFGKTYEGFMLFN